MSMAQCERTWCIHAPLVVLGAYLLGAVLAPQPGPLLSQLVFSEQGVVELGTALLFLAAGIAALQLGLQRRVVIARVYRGLYLLFAAAAIFVMLEEISYGQHLFFFEPPEWFRTHSSKNEVNLHNLMDNMPARRLNLIATIGFPTVCIALPLIMRRRAQAYRPGHWTYYLLPGTQLILLTVIAQSTSWFDDVAVWFDALTLWMRATELKELFWSAIALLYIMMIRQRVLRHAEAGEGPTTAETPREPA